MIRLYIESITEKLNNPNLHNPDNPGRQVLDGTIAEYLEHYDNHLYDLFLTRATGKYLDLHARLYGLERHDGEGDEELRERVLTEERLLERTSDFLSLNLVLWVYQSGVVDTHDTLTSRNSYLKDYHDTGYVFIGSGEDSEYVQGKVIVGDILWV